jgi:hypothetical protein
MSIMEVHSEGNSNTSIEYEDLVNAREEESKEEELVCQVVSLYFGDESDTKYRLPIVTIVLSESTPTPPIQKGKDNPLDGETHTEALKHDK